MTTVKILVDNKEIESIDLHDGNNKGGLISRGEVESVLHNNLHALIDTDQLYQLYKGINRLHAYSFPSSAENKGAWISHYVEDAKEGWYECSCCHSERAFNTNFCPDCGADMRGET